MGKNHKTVPLQAAGQQTKKTPGIASSYTSPHALSPVWKVDILQREGPYGWETITSDVLWQEILPKLRNFETMTWASILGSNNHEVRVQQLAPEAQKRLKVLKLDDVDQLVSLRLTGKQRVWGIKQHHVLRLLWWDPEHEVYPSVKKHT